MVDLEKLTQILAPLGELTDAEKVGIEVIMNESMVKRLYELLDQIIESPFSFKGHKILCEFLQMDLEQDDPERAYQTYRVVLLLTRLVQKCRDGDETAKKIYKLLHEIGLKSSRVQ